MAGEATTRAGKKPMHAGGVLRRLRKAAGLTQSELAHRVGISYQQIQKYEYGRSEMTIPRLEQLSGILGVSPSVFLSGGKKMTMPLAERELRAISLLRQIRSKGMYSLALSVLEAMNSHEK